MSETPQTAVRFRGRIGPEASSGFYAVPHRYRLYLSLSSADCLRIAVTHSLLGLGDRVPLTLLPAVPDAADGGYAALDSAYEATLHGYQGPAAAPALSDQWTGRIVSNHARDILRDLATHFGSAGHDLHPHGAADDIAAMALLIDEDITEAAQRAGRADGTYRPDRPDRPGGEGRSGRSSEGDRALRTLLAALDTVEDRLAARPYLLGEALTAADVHLWAALVQLDTVHRWHLDADAVHRIAAHPSLWTYARRQLRDPAFRSHLRLDEIARRHRYDCRGQEAAGAAVQIIDWTAADLLAPVPYRN